jgi:KDO2-lipid IV(A) lauroyltransferase
MSKPRSKVADFAVFAVVRIVVCVLQALPRGGGEAFAHMLAWLAYHADRRHRLVADNNLAHAFGGLDPASRDRLVRRVYLHFCRLLVEMVMIPRKFHPNNWRRYAELPQGRQLVDSLLSGRPLLLVTGHFGNWEMGGYALGLLGFRTYAIARPIDNPYLDRFLHRFRERTGQTLITKRGAFDHVRRTLGQGGVIATLGDQDAGQRGVFVDFFGRPASTHKGIALLALEQEARLVVLGTMRIAEPDRYAVVVTDVIDARDYASRQDGVRALTERYTTALERVVRQAPDQYLWLHGRWKHQPEAHGSRAA